MSEVNMYLVTQSPKRAFRESHFVFAAIINAASQAEAIRLFNNGIGVHQGLMSNTHTKPVATQTNVGTIHRI